MRFSKITFEGAFNKTFRDVDITYYGVLRGDLELRRNAGFYLKGVHIPIRESLWGSFENEFIMAINSGSTNLIMKFLITNDNGYKIKRVKDRFNAFMDRLVNLGFDNDEWQEPCLGERR